MFKKFFKFLYGYVIIRVYGKGAERFVNICLRRNIEVWNTKPCKDGIEMCIFARDFFLIREVVRKCHVRIKIIEKRGLLHLTRIYKKRYMFLIGFALCIALFVISAQFIWIVEINGVENCDITSVVATLDRIGIKSGSLKHRIPEGMDIKAEILSDTDGIAWAWVYIEGAKARVEIYEQTLPPNVIDKNIPCDIVAACDGVIKHIVVKNGEKIVKQGDAVKAGDVIVSGKVGTYKEGFPEEYIYVHSMASTQAYTNHSKSGEYKLYYESRMPTGKSKKLYSVEVFGKMFSLPMSELDYENYDVKETRHELKIPFFGYMGIALDSVVYNEVSINKEPISIETALEFAKNDMEEKISKELMTGSVLMNQNLEYVKNNNDTINVTLEMSFIENIAIEQPLNAEINEGEEIFDKQTD